MERRVVERAERCEAVVFPFPDSAPGRVYNMGMKRQEDQLFDILKRDPEKGLRMLIEQYSGYVRAIVRGKLAGFSRQDVEECMSDVFYSIYKSREALDGRRGSMKAFVCSVARRRAVDRLRRLSRTEVFSRDAINVDEYEYTLADDANTQQGLADSERREQLLDAVQALPPPDGQIVIRRFYFSQSNREIARALNMKENTVSKRCARAMKKLSNMLDREVLTDD